MELLPEEIKCIILRYLDVSSLWKIMVAGGNLYNSIKYGVKIVDTGGKILNSKFIIAYPNIQKVLGYIKINSFEEAYLLPNQTLLNHGYFIFGDVNKYETYGMVNCFMEKYLLRRGILTDKKFLFQINKNEYIFLRKDLLIYYIYSYENVSLYEDMLYKLRDLYKHVFLTICNRYKNDIYSDNMNIIINGGPDGIYTTSSSLLHRISRITNSINLFLDYRYKKVYIDMSEDCYLKDTVKVLCGPVINVPKYYIENWNFKLDTLKFYCDRNRIQDTVRDIKEHIYPINKNVEVTLYSNVDTGYKIDDINIKSELEYVYDFTPTNVFNEFTI